MTRRSAILAALILAAPATAARAQAPHLEHRTIRTEHFAVHFPRELEPLARRAAVHAEEAYRRLSEELVPPRGTIELVVSDNVDYANGYATVFPTNRIVVYAHPPIETPALRYNADWLQLVITHELAHAFHLDRSRGMWRMLQYVFGRNPLLFPNAYTPRWLTEGLATYYESRITGGGRIEGTYHRELARAAAREGGLPRLDEINVATPVFPGGQGVYIYGSLFIDHLARTRGPARVRELVERTAVHPVPFILNSVAKNAFGIAYSDAWREFTDSLARSAEAYQPPFPGWRDLTPPALAAEFLRWHADGTMTWTGAAPKERYGAYMIGPDGSRRYLGRRNGATPNVKLADGAVLFAQPDYVDPYTFRGDLYLDRGGRVDRLTRGARLSAPDVRHDGTVVAVQAIPGGSRLVLTGLMSRDVRPITQGSAEEYWAEPRWSPEGMRIAAVRWSRGMSSIAILAEDGRVIREHVSALAVHASPTWTPDARAVLFASDAAGSSSIYALEAESDDPAWLVGGAGNPVAWPAVVGERADSLAAVRLGGTGFRVGIAPLERAFAPPQEAPPVWPAAAQATDSIDVASVAPARRYSPLRQLLPRFWIPTGESSSDDTRFGFYTLGHDVLQRHGYEAQLAFPLRGHGVSGGAAYSYSGLKRPVLSASASQFYDWRGDVFTDTTFRERLGRIDHRVRSLAASATFLRPRVRSSISFVLGGGAEWRANVVHPELPLDVPADFYADSMVPRVTAGVAYTRVQSAPYAISPEDGFTLSVGATNRWVDDMRATSQLLTGIATGYRSLPLPGFARHVVAVRAAGGATDTRSDRALQVGGVSGAPLPLAFGLASIGEGRRTFFVRGFEGATLVGTHAWAASAEYRAPLVLIARGAGLLPFFLERSSVAVFGDAGSAWCPTFTARLCAAGDPQVTIGSVGAEARLNLAIGTWDSPFQLRGGIALPVLHRERAASDVTAFVTTGLAF